MASLILSHVIAVMDRPWVWGEADCCTAASDVFLRLYGVDPMAPLRGCYHTAHGAYRIIAQRGGFNVMTADLAALAGLREPDEQTPGCIGVIEDGARGALGICLAPGVWMGKSLTGFSPSPTVRRFWNV